MSATHASDSTTLPAPALYVAFELSWGSWKLAFTTGPGQSPRLRTIAARDLNAVTAEIVAARRRFGLAEDAAVFSCYEAGRDGFWLHRFLAHVGVGNMVVDSASIEVNRRKRRGDMAGRRRAAKRPKYQRCYRCRRAPASYGQRDYQNVPVSLRFEDAPRICGGTGTRSTDAPSIRDFVVVFPAKDRAPFLALSCRAATHSSATPIASSIA